MKKCSYCGQEYSDDVANCLIDGEPLIGERANSPNGLAHQEISREKPPILPPIIAEASPSSPPVPAPPIAPVISRSDKRLRLFELVLLCVVAFGSSIVQSGYVYVYGERSDATFNSSYYRWIIGGLHEGSALALLWYILRRRGEKFADLGLKWRWGDAWRGPVLVAVCCLGYVLVQFIEQLCGLTTEVQFVDDRQKVGAALFSGGISLLTFGFQCLNPFFEELIGKAYVITEVKKLTGSTLIAVVVSTALQTSYHLYQGIPLMLGIGSTFLICSIYYVRSGRLGPVILAHLYFDITATLYFLAHNPSIR